MPLKNSRIKSYFFRKGLQLRHWSYNFTAAIQTAISQFYRGRILDDIETATRRANGGNENEGRVTKIKKGVGTAAWLVIPSAGKSGMEMEQNTHSRNDIRYSSGAQACVSSRGTMWVRPARSRANKFPFRVRRCSTFKSWYWVSRRISHFGRPAEGLSDADEGGCQSQHKGVLLWVIYQIRFIYLTIIHLLRLVCIIIL